jgi:hypothetical protein
MQLLKEPGRYPATIAEAVLGQTDKGSPFLRLTFHAAEGQLDGYLYLSDKAIDRTCEVLKDIGFQGDFDRLDTLKGVAVSITCEIETYEGKERLKVKWVNPPSKPTAPPPAGLSKSLTARFRAIAGPAKPAPRAAAPTPTPAPVSALPGAAIDDDVPF